MATSKKDSHQVVPTRTQNLKKDHVRLKVAEECTATVNEDIDTEDPNVTVYRSERNKKDLLFMKDHADCLSNACKGQSHRLLAVEQALAELKQERAELLLRSLAMDVERTACWIYMHRKGNPPKQYWSRYRSANSLRNIPNYTIDDVYAVENLIAKWWKPKDWHERMSQDEIGDCLETFWNLRKPGIAVAHPLFPAVNYDQLLKIAVIARGQTHHKEAWDLFLAWELMDIEKKRVCEEDGQDIHIFDTPAERNRDESREARMLASLEGVELDTNDLNEFFEKLEALKLRI